MNTDHKKYAGGFTLIETMVAISLLMLALIAPMSLAAQSLVAAYYSRTQITAFYLAQEGVEVVRSVRDANILTEAESGVSGNVFAGIPYGTTLANAPSLTADALVSASSALYECTSSGCPPLEVYKNTLYGYDPGCYPSGPSTTQWSTGDCGPSSGRDGWVDTTYTRTVKAYLTNSSVNSNPNNPSELRVSVTVTWQEGSLQKQSFTISEDMYAWVSGS